MRTTKPSAASPSGRSGPIVRSGPNIPESQRSTVQRKLRLAPDVDAELVRQAADASLDVSSYVTGLVERRRK